jgi:II/X family phage/plasmid replication protein
MLIDGLRASLRWDFFTVEELERFRLRGDLIQRVNPSTGEIVWETPAWDAARSDVHQVCFRVSRNGLTLWGSPARCFGDSDAVFGAGAASALDVVGCLERMATLVGTALGDLGLWRRSVLTDWTVTRLDVTQNLALADSGSVFAALEYLRGTNGGRYRVSAGYSETVYWSHKSRYRAAKAYHKGAHIRWLSRRKDYDGRQYSDEEQGQLERVLRLELELRRDFFRKLVSVDAAGRVVRKSWWELTAGDLVAEHEGFFGAMMGDAAMNDWELEKAVISMGDSRRQGQAAWATWCRIRAQGRAHVFASMSRATWYRHLKILRAAGLRDADFSAGVVVPFRRRLEARPVCSFAELRRAA